MRTQPILSLATEAASLKDATELFCELAHIPLHDLELVSSSFSARLAELLRWIHIELADGAARSTLRAELADVREMHARSPFFRRMQTWPRGIPGDFETVEYLFWGRNQAEPGTLGWCIEKVALASPPVVQHRHKIAWQARQIGHAAEAHVAPQLLSIACGGCLDMLTAAESLADATVWLNDVDGAALELASSRLSNQVNALQTFETTYLRFLRRVETPPLHLALAGGLFDYLSDRAVELVVRETFDRLAPGGRLCFTNIRPDHDYIGWLEYIVDWQLIGRDRTDLHRIVGRALEERAFRLTLEEEATGLTFMAQIDRLPA